MKLLFYGESPCISTGLAQVSRTILDAIHDDIEVEVVGINHNIVSYPHDRYPYVIHPAPSDDCTNIKKAVERIKSGDYDIFMYSSDFGRYNEIFEALQEEHQKRTFTAIGYFPVDTQEVLIPQTFDILELFHVNVVYTHHGKAVIEKVRPALGKRTSVIYLACEPEKYYPLSQEERIAARKFVYNLEPDDSRFVCVSVNRNQYRKDLGRLMHIFHQFHKRHPDSLLYMHCAQSDFGGSLPTMALSLGMQLTGDDKEIYFTDHEQFKIITGYDASFLNLIYNASDVLLSCSTGEGWGLSTTESMAAGLPVIVPNNTAFREIVGEHEERGWLVKSGGDVDHYHWQYGEINYPREIVWAESMLEKIEDVYDRKKRVQGDPLYKTVQAREWTLHYTPEKIGAQWKALFATLGKENS